MLPLTTEVPLDVVVELLAATGVLGGVAGAWKWFFGGGRKRVPVDNAKIVSDMATKAVEALVKPLTEQVTSLHSQLATCEARADDLDHHLQQVVAYAILAHARLVAYGDDLEAPPIVLRSIS